jgi:lipoate-protein ligase A
MLSRLRVITDEPASGAWNMAVDQALLDSVDTARSGPVLRFYGWKPACLSLGYFQPDDLVDWTACSDKGIDVVRRPTGGRAILHDRELTYSVTLPLSLLAPATSVLESYLRISRALLAGLRRIGVPATLAPETRLSRPHGPACFDQPSSYEILVYGRKLVGSAQVRRRSGLLQHGSILVERQVEELLSCLALSHQQRKAWQLELDRSVVGLCEVDAGIQLERLSQALTEAMGDELGCTPIQSELTPEEIEAARVLAQQPQPDPVQPRSTAGIKTTRTR